jgi:hypothetical protein
LDADPALFDHSEIASWPHYDFTFERETWRTEVDEVLGQEMTIPYHNTNDEEDEVRFAVVEGFIRACAEAVATPEVTSALNELTRDPRFKIWVQHPDTGRQFWPLEKVEG